MSNSHKIRIIAEAGVNHNGEVMLARQLIDVAAEAGADFVKFQTFKSDKLVSISAMKADYQTKKNANSDRTQISMLRELELDASAHTELLAHCQQKKINFLSTAFDLDSLEYLKEMGLKIFKIPSGEITNYPYLKKVASVAKEVILSTGMSTLGEVESAIHVLEKYGLLRDKITVLHCNTEYPTPMRDVNLKAMVSMGNAFGVKYGYSDHTPGIEVSIAAAALGATIIEKHFTLSRELEGPDHRASLEPVELKSMVMAIRNIELALGDGVKRPTSSESKNLHAARKSIHLNQDVMKGDKFNADNLIALRPGDGISPMFWETIIGKKARSDFNKGYQLKWIDIEE